MKDKERQGKTRKDKERQGTTRNDKERQGQGRKGKKCKPQLSVFILGDLQFLEKVKKIMMQELNLNDVKISARKGIFCIKWAGNNQCKKVYDWFYAESFRFLPRKKVKFDEVLTPLQIH
jgi:hypothetical protein